MHVSTAASPYALWRSLPLESTCVDGDFWGQKQAINRQVSLRRGRRQLERAGNLNNLLLAIGKGEGEYRGPVFMDSDVYKWLEAAAYDLGIARDTALQGMVAELVDLLAAAQAPDGYLNSYYQVVRPDSRWLDLDHGHELYCAGHLFEAAVALHRATGDTQLLGVARRFADHIDSVFGPGKRAGAPGHPEIELALVELFREMGERRYLDLASFFVDQRGKGKMRGDRRHYGPEYHQDRVPVREASVVEGHAVRQLYLTAGATDLYLETGDRPLMEAMVRLWHDMTARKMHITGGFGSRFTGESFGEPYELPADRCYCETCAAIAAMMWNWRTLLATGEPRYAELLERSLYNGFLSGVSLDGQRYFYVNPLQSRGGIERREWYDCACCPPNVMRQLALVGHYAATVAEGALQIHQYLSATIQADVPGVGPTVLRMETRYPWEGHVRLKVMQASGADWTLGLRIPTWGEGAALVLNGEIVRAAGGRYVEVRRAWRAGEIVELSLPLVPRLTEPNPRIDATRSSVCVERGPLVYCLEAIDQEAGVDLLDARLDLGGPMRAVWREDLLGGVTAIELAGQVVDLSEYADQLYWPATERRFGHRETTLTAIPYYAWANRDVGAMRVWIPRRQGP